jgi:WD40 repeat protein
VTMDAQKPATRPSLRIDAPFDVGGLALRANGSRIVAGGRDGSLSAWDGASGKLLSSLKYEGPPPSELAFSANGSLLAVAGKDGSLRVLAAGSLSERRALRNVSQVQDALCFSTDGRLLAGLARSRELVLTVWDVSSGSSLASFHDASAEGHAMAFSPDNSTLAVGTLTGDTLVIETKGLTLLRKLTEPLMASVQVAFSADGRLLATASLDGALFVWDTQNWSARRFSAPRASTGVAVSPGRTHIAACSSSFNPGDSVAEALLLRWPSGEVTARQPLGVAPNSALDFVSTGRVRVATARGKTIEVWNLG